MASDSPILELHDVTVEPLAWHDTGIWQARLTLTPGELAVVRLERERHRTPICDAACGIADLMEGTVRCQGVDWTTRGLHDGAAKRASIGRLFEGHAWVSNLDVDENILLAARFHSRRPERELVAEATELAKKFGLAELPHVRPSAIKSPERRRAGLVRAFLDSPKLVLLERPTTDLYPEIMPALVDEVEKCRARGGAVLWLTASANIWTDARVTPTQRFSMNGAQMTPLSLIATGDDGERSLHE